MTVVRQLTDVFSVNAIIVQLAHPFDDSNWRLFERSFKQRYKVVL